MSVRGSGRNLRRHSTVLQRIFVLDVRRFWSARVPPDVRSKLRLLDELLCEDQRNARFRLSARQAVVRAVRPRDVHLVRAWSVLLCPVTVSTAGCSGADDTLGQVVATGGSAGAAGSVASSGGAATQTGGASGSPAIGGSAGRAGGGRGGAGAVGAAGGNDTGGVAASTGGANAGGSNAAGGSAGGADGGAGATTGGSSGASPGGTSGNGGSSSSSCNISMVGQPCTAGASCDYVEPDGCSAVSCVCSSGKWACARSTASCGTCPTPQDAHCGDPCSVTAQGCLCDCGNGPNFGGCSCTGGSWQCLGC